jgi:hypothetical protein
MARGTMRILRIYPLSFVLFFSLPILANEQCDFLINVKSILMTNPVIEAKLAIEYNDLKFVGVGDGRAPSRPGFTSGNEETCVMLKHEFNYIDAGFDHIRCKSQREFSKKLNEYASEYNKLIKNAHIEQGSYQCAI